MMSHQEERSERSFLKEYVDSLHRSTTQAGTTIEIHPKTRPGKLCHLQEGSIKQKQMQQWQYSTREDINHRQKKAKQLV